jgi:NAD(P)-dependent dehydrogenase (short-subunit alcohol dehydrogenase family)
MSPTVAITGISGGIGSATAAVFADAGWTVVGVDLVEPAPTAPIDAFATLDLGDPGVGSDLTTFFAGLSGLDALVNAAAIQGITRLEDTPIAGWDAVMDANARGTFVAMQAAHPHLRRASGAVVNVASVHAFATSTGAAPYAASKGAIVALTRAAALEWAPNVRVNAVLPGAVDTTMLRAGVQRWAAPDDVDAALETLADRIPLRRIGRPGEIAEAILFLADGRRSSFITGHALVADGGALARLSTE